MRKPARDRSWQDSGSGGSRTTTAPNRRPQVVPRRAPQGLEPRYGLRSREQNDGWLRQVLRRDRPRHGPLACQYGNALGKGHQPSPKAPGLSSLGASNRTRTKRQRSSIRREHRDGGGHLRCSRGGWSEMSAPLRYGRWRCPIGAGEETNRAPARAQRASKTIMEHASASGIRPPLPLQAPATAKADDRRQGQREDGGHATAPCEHRRARMAHRHRQEAAAARGPSA